MKNISSSGFKFWLGLLLLSSSLLYATQPRYFDSIEVSLSPNSEPSGKNIIWIKLDGPDPRNEGVSVSGSPSEDITSGIPEPAYTSDFPATFSIPFRYSGEEKQPLVSILITPFRQGKALPSLRKTYRLILKEERPYLLELDEEELRNLFSPYAMLAAEDVNVAVVLRNTYCESAPSLILEEPQPEPGEIIPLSPGTIDVKGYWYYLDEDNYQRPIKYARVEVYDQELIGSVLLRTGYTDFSGYYYFPGIVNDDGWLEDGLDIFVQIHCDYQRDPAKCAKVTDGNILGIVYWGQTDVRGGVPDGTVDMGGWAITDPDKKGSWGIYHSALTAYEYFKNASPSWDNPKLTCMWPVGSWPQFRGMPWLGWIYQMEIPAGWEWSDGTIYHEYSHSEMFTMYGNGFPSTSHGGESHSYGDEKDAGFSLIEGWAEFCEELISGTTFFEENSWADWVDSYDYDGEIIEGAVAEVLWDVADGGGGDDDGVPSRFNNLMYILPNYRPASIISIKSNWASLGYAYLTELQYVYYDAKVEQPPTPPAPTGVSATDGAYSDRVTVSWNSVSGATGYEIWWNTTNNSGSASYISDDGTSPYDHYGAAPGVTYYYWVKAKNKWKTSPFSNSDSGWRKLSPPTGVSASDGTYIDKVRVTWNSVTGASYYRVYRATSSGGTKNPLGSWQSSTTYDDTSAVAGQTYYYWVTAAVDSSGSRQSDYSSYDTGWRAMPPDTDPPSPNPMTWETEPYETSTSSISMVATAASDSSTPIYYQFEFSGSLTGGSGGDSSGWQTSRTYSDSGLQANHQYGYRVRARDSAPAQNTTSYSSPVSYDYTDIETPSGVTFGTITSTIIQVKSSNTPSGLTRGNSGLRIYNTTKGTDSGWKQDNNYWNSGGLSVNTQYGFMARARNGDADETGDCSTSYRYTYANAPGASSFSNMSENCIQANWIANGNPAGTQYLCENITRGTSSGWTTNTYWNECGLTCGTQYCYQVRAKNGDGVETASTSLGCQSTLPCPRVTLTASAGANGTVEPNGAIDVNAGQNLTFTAQPNPDYMVDKWYLDANSVQIGGATYTLYNIQSNHTILVTFKVVPTVIYVDANSPNDPGSGTLEDPYKRIQDGINAAGDGTKVIVAQGTYFENININGKNIILRSTDPNDPNVVAATIIDGNNLGSVVTIIDANANVTIDGFTITNGAANGRDGARGADGIDGEDGENGGDGFGGGMWFSNSNITISHCTFSNNMATGGSGGDCGYKIPGNICDCDHFNGNGGDGGSGYGGGIYCSNSSLTVTECAFINNSAIGGNGGFGYNAGCPCGDSVPGDAGTGSGGGIYCDNNSSLTITHCIFNNNNVIGGNGGNGGYDAMNGANGYGGGIHVSGSLVISNCVFYNNTATGGIGGSTFINSSGNGGNGYGGGLYCINSHSIINCLFFDNTANGGDGGPDNYVPGNGGNGNGGGLYCINSQSIANCTLYNNVANGGAGWQGEYYSSNNGNGDGGGLFCDSGQVLTNSILWSNIPNQLFGHDCSKVSYCDISDGSCGGQNGNISTDSRFADPNNGDYHLKSEEGRWDPNSQSWVQDDVTSPCIDAGDPNSDWTAELWPNGKRINMGAYGGTPEASMSLSDIGNIANLDNDTSDTVDFSDLGIFVSKWCYEEFLMAEDLNRDGIVNLIDFAIFAERWLEGK